MNARCQPSFLWSVVVSLALLAAACTTTHEAPQTGTETGNPPVIDASLVSLVVSQDEVHVRGAAGAATPGADIEVRSSLTGAVFSGRAAGDGSFDIRVEASTNDSFEVRAHSDGRASSAVHVVRGGASVGEDASCSERTHLALQQMLAALESADKRCTRDEDCVLGAGTTACNDSGCADRPVSLTGARELEQARKAIESGLCKDFRADGCSFSFMDCMQTHAEIGCRDQRCQSLEPSALPDAGAQTDAGAQADAGGGPVPTADCASAFDQGTGTTPVTVYWYHPRIGVCLPRAYYGTGGNDNRYATYEACSAACQRTGECPPNRVETAVCVDPGPAGGCTRTAQGCALLCAEPNALCEEEAPGWWCTAGGYCDGSSPE